MSEKFDENYVKNNKEILLERLLEARDTDMVPVDECLLSELWPASEEEINSYPNTKFSFANILIWCADNKLEGWKPTVVEKTNSEHHNFSTGERFFRPMAFKLN